MTQENKLFFELYTQKGLHTGGGGNSYIVGGHWWIDWGSGGHLWQRETLDPQSESKAAALWILEMEKISLQHIER